MIADTPPVGFSFMAVFFIGGVVPNPIDIKFRKISGISSEIETQEVNCGGEKIYLPNKVKHPNLTFERGLVVGSPLGLEFEIAMNIMKYEKGNVMVTLLNTEMIPTAGWFFQDSYPIKWAVSDFNADDNSLAIETMEVAYSRLRRLRI